MARLEAEAKKQPFSPSPLFFTKKKRGPKEKIMARLEAEAKKQPFSPSSLFFTKKKRVGPKEKIMARTGERMKNQLLSPSWFSTFSLLKRKDHRPNSRSC